MDDSVFRLLWLALGRWVLVGSSFGLSWLVLGRWVVVGWGGQRLWTFLASSGEAVAATGLKVSWLALCRSMLYQQHWQHFPQDYLFSCHGQAKTCSGRFPMTLHAHDSAMAMCAAVLLLQYKVN